ncbi:transglutaminaseTgpA domain-containing protein [Heyndrickxia oleronia]|uniref:transglutaminaseTgpA domain-containing protein n=1 Tax=Heyndrickxia oleronia TaxID=38875 RepID=UPI001B258181|nr:transglutaminaseTgpA domain-containing protein [Heyndrickxia oleronia]GIN42298.1 hypothetical protein J19TS1_52470 [Heyndrickxia oleronia]
MTGTKDYHRILTLTLYFFSFLLLMEWIYPLKEVANTGNTVLFIVFIALSFLFYLFNVPFFAVVLMKLIFILFSLHHIFFFEYFIFDIQWMGVVVKDLIKNITFLFGREWDYLTNEFRTILFFILLWLITYLLKYWLIARRSIFLFFIMTIVYITVLDTFTAYDSKMAIIRTVIFGFILLGMLFFQRFVEKENLGNSRKMMVKWMIPLVIMIIGSSFLGWIVPKASPIWPDPVPFFKSYAGGDEKGGNKKSGVSKVGYRNDDSSLGGPFIGDDTEVFQVVAESRQYWRVEMKDLYTGKGWETSKPPTTSTYTIEEKPQISLNEGIDEFPFAENEGQGDEEKKVYKAARITKAELSPNLVHTYGLANIIYGEVSVAGGSKQVNQLIVNNVTEKVTASRNQGPFSMREYAVIYQPQKYSIKKMSETNGQGVQVDPRYTQLPDNFPKRVKDLAASITKGKTNWYDKTKAIESYFQNGQFTYDQKDVAIPKEKQDYVDQFLFETQRGYCDNFSTSMVTMLRSIGIPSRWVKGYSSGTYQGSDGVSENIYKVTNNNAHSWVEVYFPNVGWVPFEPTIGFRNTSIFNNDVEQTSQVNNTDQKDETEALEKDKKETDLTKGTSSEDNFSFSELWSKITTYLNKHWLLLTSILLMICLISYVAYVKRSKWIPYLLIWKYRNKRDSNTFIKAYLSLLKQLERYGLKKEAGQTLREYAIQVDGFFGSQMMGILTLEYERSIYRHQDTSINWEQYRELWENLIKKTTG